MIEVYGIPNCNTVKKATTWLADHQLAYVFHNFKKEGVTVEKLNAWCNAFGWENVLNKKGTTWRKLSLAEQEAVVNQEAAVHLLVQHTSAIKRPIVEQNGQPILLSFKEEQYLQHLK